jgi:hypothetical protein
MLLGVFPDYVHQLRVVAVIHVCAFVAVAAALIVGCFTTPRRMPGRCQFPSFNLLSLAIGAASSAFLAVLIVDVIWTTLVAPTTLRPWAGLLERIPMALLTLWLELLALGFVLREGSRVNRLNKKTTER